MNPYIANLSLKLNPATTCTAEAHLNAIPCKSYLLDLNCQLPNNICLPDIQAVGVALAPGDKFTAGDYTVVITEITSGDPAGFIGTGYVEMKLVAGIVAKKIAVDFTNLVVNDCYEMAGGSVITQYDPNWGGVLDLDPLETNNVDIAENQGEKLIENNDKINQILDIFDCSPTQIKELRKYLDEQDALASRSQKNDDYSSTQKAEIQTSVNEIKSLVNSLIACCSTSANGRTSNTNCIAPSVIQEKIKEENSEYENLPNPVFTRFLIAKTAKRKGKNLDGSPADDLKFGDYTLTMLNAVNHRFNDYINPQGTITPLVKHWKDYNGWATILNSEMRIVANKMTDLATSSKTGSILEFEFEPINSLAQNHAQTNTALNRIKDSFIYELRKNENGFIKNVKESNPNAELKLVGIEDGSLKYNTEMRAGGLKYVENGVLRWDIPSPDFPGETNGLSITVNGTHGMDVYITKFVWNRANKTFSADLDFEVFDHYGLDRCDIDKLCGKDFYNKSGFLSWFLLQRYYGYKPFITNIKFKKQLLNVSY